MPRYIDADALIKIKFHPLPYQYVIPSDVDKESYVRGWNDVIDGIIEGMSTADVVKRKKGKWNCSDDMFEYAICSACKWDCGEAWEYAKKRFRYCPNCGADMREEADNG